MYEILLWQLRLVSTICIFCHQNQTFKQCCFFNQKSSFCPRDFQILYSPLFSFFCHCWFYRRSWFRTNSKVYRIITSLNWSLKTDLFMEKFSCPNVNIGLCVAYAILITVICLIWSKNHWELWKEVGSQSLGKSIIRVQTKNLLIGSWSNGLFFRRCIPNYWVSSSKPLVGSKVDPPFILPRSLKWVLGTLGGLVV